MHSGSGSSSRYLQYIEYKLLWDTADSYALKVINDKRVNKDPVTDVG